MADKEKNPVDYVKSLQEKEKHFELSAMTLSFGVPLLNFLSPLAADFKVDFSKSPDTPKDEPLENLKDSMLWQVFDLASEEKLLFVHIAHFEDCFEPWFSFLDHYLRHLRSRNKKVVILASLNKRSAPSPVTDVSRLHRAGLMKKVQLKALNEVELRAVVDQRFSPNTFGEDFYHALLTITSGSSTFVTEMMRTLMHDGATTENIKTMCWELADDWEASLDPYLPERFDEVVDKMIAKKEAHVKKETVLLFLSVGALIGNVFPVELVLKAMDCAEGAFDTDALLDIVDAGFCDTTPKALEDLGFKNHLFENVDRSIAAYCFNNRIMQTYFSDQLFDEKIFYGDILGNLLEEQFPDMPKPLWSIIRDLYHAGQNDQKEGQYQRMMDWDLPEETFNLLQDELRQYIGAGDFKSRELHFTALFHLLQKRMHQWHAGTLLGIVKILEWLWDDFLNRWVYGVVLYYRSYFLKQLGRMEDAHKAAEDSLFIARETGDRQTEGASLSMIGDIHQEKGAYVEAKACYDPALKIAREMDHRQGEGMILSMIGKIHHTKGAYAEAMACCELALKIALEMGHRQTEVEALSMIGKIHHTKGAYAEAMSCYELALKIAREIGHRQDEGAVLLMIGKVHHTKGAYAEAMACYELSLKIACEIGDRLGEEAILSVIGEIYKKRVREGN